MATIIDSATLDDAAIRALSEDHRYWVYNGLDCCVTEDVRANLAPKLDEVARRTYEFSLALQAPVLEMTMRGLLVNQNRRHTVITEMREKLAVLEEHLAAILREGVGLEWDFNWRSPTQVGKLFYDVMQLPPIKKRKANGTYGPSTDREALEALSIHYLAEPVCRHLLALRDLGKSIGFLETGIDSDGRMRTSVNIAGTNTGRFSSAESDFGTGTNLQNVTSSLRSVFVADPGYKFANLDLEQADARNVGALCWNAFVESRGESFAGAFLDLCESGDLHTNVCKMANPHLPWGTAPDRQIADGPAYRSKSHRDLAKALGHGSNYLGTPPTMSKHTKIPVPLVKDFQARYFTALPCIPAWHTSVFAALEATASLTTPFGRRRYFFGRSNEAATRREAVAYQPQSMTADQINTGLLALWRANRIQLLMQVHDSVLFQYPEELEDSIIPWALDTLRTHLTLTKGRSFVVPTEAMTGFNWGYYSEGNPDGLKKWRGADDRKRQETNFRLSFSTL